MITVIESIIKKNSIDIFGIGDLQKYGKKLSEQGFPVSENFTRAISIGIRLSDQYVDKLWVDCDVSAVELYRHFCYDLINQQLDASLLEIAKAIEKQGHDALPIPASKTADETNLYGSFSHKAGAYISGLGWIGKSCLLVNKEHGPRMRWGTVLTNAPLTASGKPMDRKCGKCNTCVEACPAGAFTGEHFSPDAAREIRYDAFKCHEYLSRREKTVGLRVCGLCLQVCPYGKST